MYVLFIFILSYFIFPLITWSRKGKTFPCTIRVFLKVAVGHVFRSQKFCGGLFFENSFYIFVGLYTNHGFPFPFDFVVYWIKPLLSSLGSFVLIPFWLKCVSL